ncbi:hypothetical protein MAQ5080_02998 [Marinomonas aquimarina]|uniref:Uncharacterized protein n=1 Tax=Marinomonas aquimarina TaxID=295068 RepID=A0A1A8TLQ5_9GAMM|nr:hypothetical protein [Marinomonas aquimarina]SBS34863.1 hypothetical protein MAQ5080_02998 [Marinomonas aquimarina]
MAESQLSFQSRYAMQSSTFVGQKRTRLESEEQGSRTELTPRLMAQAQFFERISAQQEVSFQAQTQSPATEESDAAVSATEMRFSSMLTLLERMFGIKIDVFDASELDAADAAEAPQLHSQATPAAAPQESPRGRRQVIEAIQEYRVVTETESSSVAIAGKLALNDGRQLDVQLNLDMSRTRKEEYWGQMTLSARTVDPLVVNLNGNAAQLTNQRMAFDIDADGEEDQVAFATGDSAFLALDKNDNGSIDDGNELFGPKSGSGFADLANYDDNQDGLIDSLDDIWQKLLLVQRDESGNESILSLKEVGISAFVLERTRSPFSLFNNNGEQTGIIRETGLYVRDDNSVDTLQHVDLVV